ncbi:MAG: ABC transporter permease subunit, partial [Edaphobacter sp.]
MIRFPNSFSNIPGRETLARSQVLQRSWPFVLDMSVAGLGLACFYGVVVIARSWFGHFEPAIMISQSPRALPLYAFYSVVRIGLAYLLSLIFAIGYGYIAAYNKRIEALMIAALDILQSIPVLSFLPGVMLAMVALFPTRQIGVEMGAIVLIFTGQVWNMAFSFYSSIKSIPRELSEAASIYKFSRLQKLIQLELPYSAIGLVWNSMVSVAGGWFFLMACEMFVLGTRDFRLPGLGSYLQTAASTDNKTAMAWG